MLSIDFETRSTVDLRRTGAAVYAESPTTDIWCMSYAFDDEPVETWAPQYPLQLASGEWRFHELPFPTRIVEYVAAGGDVRAWNARFERAIWGAILGPRYGVPVPEVEQWHDTQAEALAMGLPAALGMAAKVLGVEELKDGEGHNLMLRMARPRGFTRDGRPIWWEVPDRVERLIRYCEQDVRTERAVMGRVRRLVPRERAIFLLDQRINDRGVQLDLPLATAAAKMLETGIARANEQLQRLTSGEVSSVQQTSRLRNWLNAQGVDTATLRKDVVRDLLSGDALDPASRYALEIRAEAGVTSAAKLESMLAYAGRDGRMHDLLQYYGAHTGRWAGRGPQPQNMPRGEVPDVEHFIPAVLAGDYDRIDLEHPPLKVLSSMLRSMLIAAPGCRLMAADYSAIEARVLAWCAGQQDLVELFRSGGKVYEAFAARLYGTPVESVTKDQRQFGKVGILGCGYQMGPDRLVEAARTMYGLQLTREESQAIVSTYRGAYPDIVDFWYALQRAALAAVQRPGSEHRAGPVSYLKAGPYLWCRLPAGRFICYADPKIVEREMPWSTPEAPDFRPTVRVWGVDGLSKQWQSYDLYGGLQAENVVQAISRDLLADAMLRLDAAGYLVILSVHDEVVCEVPVGHGSLEEFMALMSVVPDWAAGCPVAAEGWEGERYRK